MRTFRKLLTRLRILALDSIRLFWRVVGWSAWGGLLIIFFGTIAAIVAALAIASLMISITEPSISTYSPMLVSVTGTAGLLIWICLKTGLPLPARFADMLQRRTALSALFYIGLGLAIFIFIEGSIARAYRKDTELAFAQIASELSAHESVEFADYVWVPPQLWERAMSEVNDQAQVVCMMTPSDYYDKTQGGASEGSISFGYGWHGRLTLLPGRTWPDAPPGTRTLITSEWVTGSPRVEICLAIQRVLWRDGPIADISYMLGAAWHSAFDWMEGFPSFWGIWNRWGIPFPWFLLVMTITVVNSVVRGFRYDKKGRAAWASLEIASEKSSDDSDAQVQFFMLSDLHIVDCRPSAYPTEIAYLGIDPNDEDQFSGEAIVRKLESLLLAINMRQPPSSTSLPVIIAGDITDDGAGSQWRVCESVFEKYKCSMKFILVPGNHDILIPKLRGYDLFDVRRLVLPFFDQISWSRRKKIMDLQKALGGHELAPFSETGEAPDGRLIRTVSIGPQGLKVILVDSTQRECNMLMSNAIGEIGPRQRAELASEIESWNGDHALVIVLHHHPARCDIDPEKPPREEYFLLAHDGDELLRILNARAAHLNLNMLVIHGHRHLQRFGAYERVYVYGLASSTLGDATGRQKPSGSHTFTEVCTSGADVVIRVVNADGMSVTTFRVPNCRRDVSAIQT